LKAAQKEEALQRGKLEKEAAEARRLAKKESAAKKLVEEQAEAERRRKAKREEAEEMERHEMEEERRRLEQRVLDCIFEHEKVGKLVEEELNRLERLVHGLGLSKPPKPRILPIP